MDIIVTGATSFIGVNLIEKLLRKGHFIYALIRPNSANISRMPVDAHLKVIELNLNEIGNIKRYVNHADAFYHLAWEGTRAPWRDDAHIQQMNYEAAVEAIRVAMDIDCYLFVGSGSQAEYGRLTGPVDENYPCKPTTEYGKAKYRAYSTLSQIAKEMGIRMIWPRIFSLYGKYDYPGTLVMSCIDKMSRNEPMDMTECSQYWDYLHVSDAAEALARFLEKECESGVYHIASGEARPLRCFVEEIRQTLGSSSELHYGAVPYGKNGPVGLEPIVTKTKETLDWKAEITFRQGIQALWNAKKG